MIVANVFVLALFTFTPVRMLVGYWRRGAEQKPRWFEIAGILFCTVGMLVYMAVLIGNKQFY